jgi:excisionase family DNA binding protein
MKHANAIPGIQHLLSLPHERNRNYGNERRKSKYRLYGGLRPNGVNMCPQSQPSEPNRSSGQSAARGPFDAERATWLTAAEVAAYLNFKVRTILLWARQGRVKAYALTGTQRRVWRFLQVDLDAIVIQKKPVVSSAQPSVLVNERRI